MYIDHKKILLSGATGMVGSAILKHIIKNHPTTKVKAVYSKHTEPFIKSKNITYVYGDLRDGAQCRKLARGCDCAILAAAVTLSSLSAYRNPLGFAYDNLSMNHLMLETLHDNEVEKVICIGSATVYQEHDRKIREDELDFNQDPEPAYYGVGWAGRFIEKMCKKWHDLTGKSMIIVRASNVFGPYAKFNPLYSNFVPALIRKAEQRTDPFEVFGREDVRRDVIFSDDFADAVMRLINKNKIRFDVFNVGSGDAVKVGKVAKVILSKAGYMPSKVYFTGIRGKVSGYRAIDTEKIRETAGWVPAHSLEEGIAETFDWWRENKRWWKK